MLLVAGFLATACHAVPPVSPEPTSYSALGLPPSLSKARLQSLLQSFVDTGYGRYFRHIGDERDFDHGHLLLNARTLSPVAILYHTQELAHDAASADYSYLDASARNWIQWLDGRGIVNASLYERTAYPSSASWDWFVDRELPKLRKRHTITDKMLDPVRIGGELGPSLQWTFTQVACGPALADESSDMIGVILPDRTPVCLALKNG